LRNNFNKIYIIHINVGKIFESSLLINLFENINIARIFYKSNQTGGTHTTRVGASGTGSAL
jgi:hypothetical protein